MNAFLEYCKTNWLELISVVFSLWSVWLAAKEKIGLYPTGLVAVIIAFYIYFSAKLYADMGVQVYYFVASIYGWWNWTKLKSNNQTISNISSLKEWGIYLLLTCSFFATLYILLLQTDTDVPFFDSIINALFITGMILMAQKRIENWIFWIVGDMGSIFISWYKGLHFFAAQYIVFTILATYAYFLWYKKLKHEK